MTDIRSALHAKGLKATSQRLAIYGYLISTDTHPSAEEIYNRLKKEHPHMSPATVYKTLASLKKAGLVRELSIGGDCFRYDAALKTHAHLVCKSCHTVTDYCANIIPDDTALKIASDTGFAAEEETIYFYGLCERCRCAEDDG